MQARTAPGGSKISLSAFLEIFHGENPAGALVVGSPESVLTYRLPRILKAFRARFPDVELVFRDVNSAELVPQLERAELDLGLVIDDGLDDSRFRVETLCAEPLSLLASSRHPLFALGTIGAEDLRDQPFLLTDPGCAYRTKLERALATANIRLKAVMEFTSVETIKQCAGLGMGIACLPTIVAESEIAARKLVALRWSGSDLARKIHDSRNTEGLAMVQIR